MAERKRRGEQAADGSSADGAEDCVDEVEAEALSDTDDALESSDSRGGQGAAVATKARSKSSEDKNRQPSDDGKKRGFLVVRGIRALIALCVSLAVGLANFVREVVAELRKVIWPTRSELVTYTTVVVAFVTLMLTIVGLLDYGFGEAAFRIFGGGSASGDN